MDPRKLKPIIYNRYMLINVFLILGMIIDISKTIKYEYIIFLLQVFLYILIQMTFIKIRKMNLNWSKEDLKLLKVAGLFYLSSIVIILSLTKLNLPHEVIFPFILLMIAPPAISTIYITSEVKGNISLSVKSVFFMHLFAIITIPSISFLYSYTGAYINLNISSIIKSILIFILLPYIISKLLLRTKAKTYLDRFDKVISHYLYYLLLIIIFLLTSKVFYTLGFNTQTLSLIYGSIIGTLLFFVFSYTIVKIIYKRNKDMVETLVLEAFYKNYLLTALLISNSGLPREYVLPVIIYSIIANIFLSIYMTLESREHS